MGRAFLHNKDFLAGVLFFALGLGAIHIADRDYPMGTAMRMGPGNFPVLLGGILGLFGIYLAARGLAWPEKTPGAVAWEWRPVGCITGAMLAFSALNWVR